MYERKEKTIIIEVIIIKIVFEKYFNFIKLFFLENINIGINIR
jgi:hypothetical protein